MERPREKKSSLPARTSIGLEAVRRPSFKTASECLVLGLILLLAENVLASNDPSGLSASKAMGRAYEFLQQGRHDSSIALFSEAAAEFRAQGEWGSYLYCLNGIGENLIRLARYGEAQPVLQQADSVGRGPLEGRDPGLIRSLHLRGYLALYEGDFPVAISLFGKAMHLSGEIAPGDTLSLVNCLHMLGIAESGAGNSESAEEHLRSALLLMESSGAESGAARAAILLALSRNQSAQGRYYEAKATLLKTHELLAASPQSDPGALVACLEEWSDVDFRLGLHRSSLELGEEALTRSRQLFGDHHPLTVNQIARLGDLQASAGRYEEAILYLTQATSLYEGIEGRGTWALGTLHQRLANAYRLQGDLERALVHARKGLSLAEGSNGKDHPGNAALHETLAETHLALGDYQAALSHARSAAALYRSAASERNSDLARNSTLLAEVSNRLGLHRAALALADTALELYEPDLQSPGVARAWRVRGEAYLGLDEMAAAKDCFRQSIATLGLEEPLYGTGSTRWMDLYSGREAVQSLLAYARASQERFGRDPTALTELKAGYEASRQAVGILTDMRAHYQSEQPKLDLALFGESAFKEALRLALRMHEASGDASYLNEAFSLAEASKAGSLIDAVVRAGGARFSGIPAGLLEREKHLKRELFACDTRLHALGDAREPLASTLVSRRFELQRELDQLLAVYSTNYAEFAGLARRPRPITPAEAMALLDGHTALVEYCLLDDLLVTFVVTSEDLTCRTTPVPGDFQGAVLQYCETLRTFDVASYSEQARMLGSLLLDPIEGEIQTKGRLLLVPCDYLWYLPFETLLTAPPGVEQDFTDMPYLLTRHEVTYLYSATFFGELESQSERPRATLAFAGFAPGFDAAADGPYAQVLSPADAGVLADHVALAGDLRRSRFGPLPQAGREVARIADAFSHKEYGWATFVGEGATETMFKRRAPEFAYLHIASHSYIDKQHPGLTGILFSATGDAAEDGVLHAGEMFDLELEATLVVLSSCESGLGRIVPGEGLLAMTRGLFWSGARNVMVSLWDVYDAHASELMVGFYPGLLGGASIASSLRDTKLAMIADPRTAFPGKWGGFVHMGID